MVTYLGTWLATLSQIVIQHETSQVYILNFNIIIYMKQWKVFNKIKELLKKVKNSIK